jgi:RimJ/RimL family protein N-acetyltransferase
MLAGAAELHTYLRQRGAIPAMEHVTVGGTMAPFERSTARLRLRRVTMDDLAAFVALEASLRAREEPPRERPAIAQSARYLADFTRVWDRGELGYWTIVFQGRIAGFGGVQPKLWRERRCWNLYYRVAPDFWGLGIATEMAREAIAAAAAVHPAWPVVVETRPWNTAAIRVAERAGLSRQEARIEDEYAVLLLETTC